MGGGGGRGPFELDYFHATPIGLMVNVENITGTGPPIPQVAPAHVAEMAKLRQLYGFRPHL